MKKWIPEIVVALLYFLLLHLIPNEFVWSDEYRFATWLRQGEAFFHSHHALSSVCGYLVWAFTSIFGIKISAWDALRLVNELGAVFGSIFLYAIGLQFGLPRLEAGLATLLFSLSNGIMRYGVSGNPALGAIGLGLLATWIGLRAFSNHSTKTWLLSALMWSIAVAQHSVVNLMLAGFVLTLFLARVPYRQIALFTGFSGLGVIAGQLAVAALIRWAPLTVYPSYGDMFSKAGSIPFRETLPWVIKTHVAVLFPGIHSASSVVDLLLNLPRLLVTIVVACVVVAGFRTQAGRHRPWILPLGSLLLFAALCVLYPTSRQYAVMTWIALGPSWMMLVKRASFRLPVFALRGALGVAALGMLVHGILGVEGIAHLGEPRCPQLKPVFEPYGAFEKRFAPWPLFPDKPRLPPSKLFEVVDIDCAAIQPVPVPKYE
jgi:hypothetical protein